MISIRPEEPRDHEIVHAMNLAAFEGGPEADLVDALRLSCPDHLSLVAEEEGRVVGHILFTPVVIESVEHRFEGMGLAPMAVTPERHRCGAGSELVRHGLEVLQERSCPFVVVLGHPEYYPRFGFERASTFGLRSQWDGVPDEAFMVLVFDPCVLPEGGGVARYRDEFDAAILSSVGAPDRRDQERGSGRWPHTLQYGRHPLADGGGWRYRARPPAESQQGLVRFPPLLW